MVQNSAKLTQEEEKWLTDAKVQALKFSRKWVFLFFRRQKVKRRRITRDLKDIPSETTVRLIMGAAQQKNCNGGYLPHQIINLDETAINWSAIQKRSIYYTQVQDINKGKFSSHRMCTKGT